jgi:hypothetical protein
MSLGAEGIKAGRDLYQLLDLALNARSEGELDAAGAHLAKATAYIARDNSAQGWHFVTSYSSK